MSSVAPRAQIFPPATRGRLAEVFGNLEGKRGKTALDEDRRMRVLGFYRAAREAAGNLDAETLVALADRGVPSELLETVFEPFVTTRHQGTGLGLPIVKGQVEAHGGERLCEGIFGLVRENLPERLWETAYALACDIAAADGTIRETELRLLEEMRYELNIDRLHAAAIERGARARHLTA